MTHFGPILDPFWDHPGAHILGEGRGNGINGTPEGPQKGSSVCPRTLDIQGPYIYLRARA